MVQSRSGALCHHHAWASSAGAGKTSGNEVPYRHGCVHMPMDRFGNLQALIPIHCLMQVEIKLRLPNKEAHDKVAEALKDAYIETHDQENFFYEGSEKELNKARVSLRTRFYGGDKKCVITMKVTWNCVSAAFKECLSPVAVMLWCLETPACNSRPEVRFCVDLANGLSGMEVASHKMQLSAV